MVFQTEFEFTLPKGYVDKKGTFNKKGIMRLATAADEILPLKDPRVQANPAYLTVILLSRVITKLGKLACNRYESDRKSLCYGSCLPAGFLRQD